MRLTRDQRNEIFEAVEGVDLPPSHFRWETTTDGSRDVLLHPESGDRFEFGPNLPRGDSPAVAYARAITRLLEGSWRTQRRRCRAWLADLKHELDTPDLWAQIEHERDSSTGGPAFWESFDRGTSNAPFTPAEQEQIASRLDELRRTIVTRHELSAAQLRQLDGRIEQLRVASRRLGRKDWLMLFLGTMFSLAASAVLPAEAVGQLADTVIHGLETLYRHLPPQLPSS